MATAEGMQFGSEIIYTYGPLGFLRFTMVWDTGLVVFSWLYCGLVFVAVCIGLIEIARRATGALWATFLTFVVLALLGAIEQPVVLAVIFCGLVLRKERGRNNLELVALAGGALAATEMLVKFTTGPLILIIVALALFGARARRRQLLLFALSFVGFLTLLWLAAGQEPGGFLDYLVQGYAMASAYGDAMALRWLPAWQALVAGFLAVVVIALTVRGEYRDRRARVFAVAVTTLVVLALMKQGLTRYDDGHLITCLTTLIALTVAIPAARKRQMEVMALILLAVTAALFVVPEARRGSTGTVAIFPPGNSASGLNFVSNIGSFASQVANVVDSDRRVKLQEEGRRNLLAQYGLDEETLGALRGNRVMIDPWEVAVAWAYDLDWTPIPTVQNLMAFTTDLDHKNAVFLTAPDGPNRILRDSPDVVYSVDPPVGVDGRLPAWDPPEQQRTTYCWFRPVVNGERWQVLARTSNRCLPLEPLSTAYSQYGESVAVPDPGPNAVTVLKLRGTEVRGSEKIRSLLLRARQRYLIVNGYTGYRLPPETASDGLMVRGGGLDAQGQPPIEIPQATTLELQGSTGDLTYEFFRMPLHTSSE